MVDEVYDKMIPARPSVDWNIEDYRQVMGKAIDKEEMSKLDSYVKRALASLTIFLGILAFSIGLTSLGVLISSAVGTLVFVIAYYYAKEKDWYDWIVYIACIFNQFWWIAPSTLLLAGFVSLSVLQPSIPLSGIGVFVPFALIMMWVLMRYVLSTQARTKDSLWSIMSRIVKKPDPSTIPTAGKSWGMRSWLILGFAEGYSLMLLFGSVGFVGSIVFTFLAFSPFTASIVAPYLIHGAIILGFILFMVAYSINLRNDWISGRMNDAVITAFGMQQLSKGVLLNQMISEIAKWN